MATAERLPTYFVSHGGGPWPWMKDLMPFDTSVLETSLAGIPAQLGSTPRAVLVVSAHWEEAEVTVQTHPNPPMYYDYGGFPDFTYRIQYPAPGSPEVAARVAELLTAAGIPVRQDPARGFDHGTFAPLYVLYPDADVPVLQLSLRRGLDPATHVRLGRVLAPLRDEGVLIVGSGSGYHNLRQFGPAGHLPSLAFDDWLRETLAAAPVERTERLVQWEQAPGARASHPREEHLVPLMVALGAAEDEAATRTYHETSMAGGIVSSSYAFGLQA